MPAALEREMPLMPKKDPHAARVRAICLAFPGTAETMTWGSPHYRVDGKIFAGYGPEKAGEPPSLGVKSTLDEQAALIASDERFFVPPYVGKKGWVGFRAVGRIDWAMIETLVERSYRFIAKKSRIRELDGAAAAPERQSAPAAKRARAPKKTAARTAQKKKDRA